MRYHQKLDPIDRHALLPAQFGMPASRLAERANYLTIGFRASSGEGTGLWILLLLLTPLIPTILVIYTSLGYSIFNGPSIARKLGFVAAVKEMYGAYQVSLWLMMMTTILSLKITLPATGVLLLLLELPPCGRSAGCW